MTIHRVKLKDLNKEYIERLQQEGGDKEQEITIWVNQKSTALSEKQFWEIIDLMNWRAKKPTSILAPAQAKLAQLSVKKIESFHDHLSEKLYALDGQKYAEQIGTHAYKGEDHPFSADGFLYARCMAIAKGKKVYESIIVDPTNMVKDDTFEALLSLPFLAYQEQTGNPFEHIPAYLIETFANPDGWDGQDLLQEL